MNTPKTFPCRDCGLKPKRQIVAWGYTEKDDEFFLVHKCNGKQVRFPEKGRFFHLYANGQEPVVVEAWNKERGGDCLARGAMKVV